MPSTSSLPPLDDKTAAIDDDDNDNHDDDQEVEVTFEAHVQRQSLETTTTTKTTPLSTSKLSPPVPSARPFGRRRSASGGDGGSGTEDSGTDGGGGVSSRRRHRRQNHHRRSQSLGNNISNVHNSGGSGGNASSGSGRGHVKSKSSSNSASFFANIASSTPDGSYFYASSGGGSGGGGGLVPMNPFEAGNMLEDDTAASVGDDDSLVYKTLAVPDSLGHDLMNNFLPIDTIITVSNHENSDGGRSSRERSNSPHQSTKTTSSGERDAAANNKALVVHFEEFDKTSKKSEEMVSGGVSQTHELEHSDATSSGVPEQPIAAADDDENDDNEVKEAPPTQSPPTSSSRSVITAGIESFKYLYSLGLLIFCVVLVMGAIFTKQTTSTAPTISESGETSAKGFSPIGAFFIFWFLIVWLAMMEGGQGALVGLQPVDSSLYEASHPRAYRSTRLMKNGNMERFIVGRQFLVVLLVFVMQLMSSAVANIQLWGLSSEVTEIFLESGVALMVVTIVLGQLTAQLNAANCMLDFINNYFMLYFVTCLSLVIEFSGLLHSVYLVQFIFAKFTAGSNGGRGRSTQSLPVAKGSGTTDAGSPDDHTPNEKNDQGDEEVGTGGPLDEKASDDVTVASAQRTLRQNLFFGVRVLVSFLVLGFAFAVTLSALFQGKTTMWQGVPPAVSVVLFFLLMCFVGMMEGMQIALFAVLNYSQEDLAEDHPVAHRNCDLTFRGENLQAFLIGRQICVTICTFVIARITTLDVQEGDGNIFGFSDGMQAFFNTGLLGAVITTIVSSLAWRIIASSFPLAFLSNPFITPIIRLCLLLEASGICSSAWVMARFHKLLVHYKPDEVYLKEGNEAQPGEAATTRDRDIDRFVSVSRFSFSLGLLFFSITLLLASIFTRQTNLTVGEKSLPPVAAFFILILLIGWLAMMEGGQGCIIGLQNVHRMKFVESHPRTFQSTSICARGDNLQRFIVGRQLLVLVVVFLCQWISSPVPNVSVLGLPKLVNEIFLSSGLALMFTVIMIGQLMGEVNAANCMLDFANNYVMVYLVTYLSLLIEYTGLLHTVYLVQILFSKITGQTILSREESRNRPQQIFFWFRVVMSLLVLGYALAVTLEGLLSGKTTMWLGVPSSASVAIFFVLICFVGLMEGIQIALFSVVGLAEEELMDHRIAYANYNLTFSGGQNLQAFLVGRQICVTACFFILARITTLNVKIGVDDNIFSVSNGVQEFFNTGLLGALISTILASLAWRVIASSFPVFFMSNPLIYLIIRLCLVVDASGVCSASWVLGRWNKILAGYQPDVVYLEEAEREGKKPVTRRDKDIDVTITVIKYIFSTALLMFGVSITVSLIFSEQTELSKTAHPAVAFVLIWFLLAWLGMMEGGQGCLVGLQGLPPKLYENSHPKTFKNTTVAHTGNNMRRFIVGRQFLVVLVVFIINLCGSPQKGSKVFGLPDVVTAIFVDSNLSLILVTVILGQLMAQVNAASCMLDFIDNYFMLFFVTYISLAIEWSGLLHSVYLVQILFSKIAGTPVASNEPTQSGLQQCFFWIRTVMSLAILGFAFAVTLDALFQGKTTFWEGVPGAVSVVIFFVLMCVAGLMEGMQIALFAVANLPGKALTGHKLAKATKELTFSGNNLQAFLIGRQICVTLCTFVIAKITTLNVHVGAGENIFGVPDGLQAFFNTGLLGAIITTIVGSLAWRIIAASFPVVFLSNPLIYFLLRLCLLVEASGICSSAWLLALINKQIVGFRPDEDYVGRREDWEEANVEDGVDEDEERVLGIRDTRDDKTMDAENQE